MAATCMAVCKGSRKKIRGIFISSCHLPAAVECDIVILSKPGPNPTGSSWAVLRTQLIPARGRKRQSVLQVGVYFRHNLSPRGDGNKFSIGVCEDGKLVDTTYPREGTETANLPGPTLSPARHNLSPRGDGNKSFFCKSRKILGHNLSPRGDGWAIVGIGPYYAVATKT